MLDRLGAFLASGRVLDAVLACVLLELLGLLAWRLLRGEHRVPPDVYFNLGAAAALLLAAHAVLAGAHWGATALCLLAALGAHLVALGQRWRQPVSGVRAQRYDRALRQIGAYRR